MGSYPLFSAAQQLMLGRRLRIGALLYYIPQRSTLLTAAEVWVTLEQKILHLQSHGYYSIAGPCNKQMHISGINNSNLILGVYFRLYTKFSANSLSS